MFEKGFIDIEKNHTIAERWYRKAAEQGYAEAQESLDRIVKERERENNAFGVAGVKLGMTDTQVERRLGKFNLIASGRALTRLMTGGLLDIESVDPDYVEETYVAVNPKTGAGLGLAPGLNQETGQFQFNQSAFEKDSFKFWTLTFTRKELGPKLLSMKVSREFNTQPDWNAVEEK